MDVTVSQERVRAGPRTTIEFLEGGSCRLDFLCSLPVVGTWLFVELIAMFSFFF